MKTARVAALLTCLVAITSVLAASAAASTRGADSSTGHVTTRHHNYGPFRHANVVGCALSGGRVQSVSVQSPQVKGFPGWRHYRYKGRVIVAQTVVWRATLLFNDNGKWRSVADKYTYVSAKFGKWSSLPTMKPFKTKSINHGQGEFEVKETVSWLKPTGSGQKRDGWIIEYPTHYTYPYATNSRSVCSNQPPTCTSPGNQTMFQGQTLDVALGKDLDPDGDPTSATATSANIGGTPVTGFVRPAKHNSLRLKAGSAEVGQTVTVDYKIEDAAGAKSGTCTFDVTVSQASKEQAGEKTQTWTDYAHAAGTQGPDIDSGQSVYVSCWVKGKPATDKNAYWYRVASSPWNDQYYASADAFYNGATALGSVQVDPNVAQC